MQEAIVILSSNFEVFEERSVNAQHAYLWKKLTQAKRFIASVKKVWAMVKKRKVYIQAKALAALE